MLTIPQRIDRGAPRRVDQKQQEPEAAAATPQAPETGASPAAAGIRRRTCPSGVAPALARGVTAAAVRTYEGARQPRVSLCARVTMMLAGTALFTGMVHHPRWRAGEQAASPPGPLNAGPAYPETASPAPRQREPMPPGNSAGPSALFDTDLGLQMLEAASAWQSGAGHHLAQLGAAPAQPEADAKARATHKADTDSGTRGGDRASLQRGIERALRSEAPVQALRALALALAGDASGILPRESLSRLVSAFRASPSSRQPEPMRQFLQAMFHVMEPSPMDDGRLEQLLRVWHWRYGEAEQEYGIPAVRDTSLLSDAFIPTVVEGLKQKPLTARQLQLLVRAVGQEPEDIVPGKMQDQVLQDHAHVAAAGLLRLMGRTSDRPGWGTATGLQRLEAGHVRRCLRLFILSPAQDPRWKAAVLVRLQYWAETQAPSCRWMPIEEWTDLLLASGRELVAAVHPDLASPLSLTDVGTAMTEPDRYRAGVRYQAWFGGRYPT